MAENVDPDELVRECREKPGDGELRAKAAWALHDAGRPSDAVQLLTERLINLTAHTEGPLPPLSKLGIDASLAKIEVQGTSFERWFAVRAHRVLFFWVPSELASQREKIVAQVTQRMPEN